MATPAIKMSQSRSGIHLSGSGWVDSDRSPSRWVTPSIWALFAATALNGAAAWLALKFLWGRREPFAGSPIARAPLWFSLLPRHSQRGIFCIEREMATGKQMNRARPTHGRFRGGTL